MANRYVRAVGGNWNAAGTWEETPGGGESVAVPTSADDVFLVVGSGQLTINAAAACRSFNCTGYANTVTHNAFTLTIGDGTAPAGGIAILLAGTYTPNTSAAITFNSSGAGTHIVDFASKTLGATATITFSGSSSYQFANGFTCYTISHSNGTLDTNNKSFSVGLLSTNGNLTRTLTLGSSIITSSLTGGNALVYNGSNCTVTANTAIISFTGASPSVGCTDGTNWNGLSIKIQGAAGTFSFNNACTINALVIDPTTTKTIFIMAGKTITLTNLFCYPSGGKITFTGGSISKSSGTVNMYYVNSTTTTFTGGATFKLMGGCTVVAADATTYGLTITGASFFCDVDNGSDTIFAGHGVFKVAYTSATGTCPVIGETMKGGTSNSSAKVNFINEYEWSTGSGTLYFSTKDAAFVAETLTGLTGSGTCSIAADFISGAWKFAAATKIGYADSVYICKSGGIYSIGNATWTDRSKTVTLAGARTITVDMCETAWTKNGSGDTTVTRGSTYLKEGTYNMRLALDSSPQTNIMQAYYATGTLDLHTTQKLSFWLYNTAAIAVNNWIIALCSDTAGAIPVDIFQIPAIASTFYNGCFTLPRAYSVAFTDGSGTAPASGSTITGATSLSTGVVIMSTLASGTWAGGDAAGTMFIYNRSAAFVSEQVDQGANHFHITTDFAQGNLGSSIKSIAAYTGNTAPTASSSIYVDNFIACLTNDLSLTSLISKNSSEQGGTECWYGIKSINGTTVILDDNTVSAPSSGRGYTTTGTTPETITTYIRDVVKPTIVASTTTVVLAGQSGISNYPINYYGGYNSTNGNIDGETFLDGTTGVGYGLTLGSYTNYDYINFCRFYNGYYLSSSYTNISINHFSTSNCSSYGIYINTGTNITLNNVKTFNNLGNGMYIASCNYVSIGTIINASSNGSVANEAGVYILTSSYISITTITQLRNNYDHGVCLNQSNGISIETITSTAYQTTSGIFSSSCDTVYIGTITVSNITNNGLYAATSKGIRVNTATITNCNRAVNSVGGHDWIINSLTTSGNTYVFDLRSTVVNVRTATIAEANIATFSVAYLNSRVTINKLVSTGYSYIATYGDTIVSQAATAGGTGIEWKISPTSTARTLTYPISLTIARIAVERDKAINISAYIKKSHATDIGARLICRGGQIGGIASDVYTDAPSDTTRNSVALAAMTPNETGVIEIEVWAYWIANAADENVIVDDITVTQS